ncbi:Hypp6665 [Branchiostoma lanceolatum]|uniref:Hypp6665 protein n=1 Tax=Branchiostoma lanceolatum TaxID=7740 RepID=A0A8J9YVH5_BRALA|nr:Hypp6665 [Branchiostoma lanceolatum]
MEADNPAVSTGQVSSQDMEANNPAMPTGQVSSQDMEANNPAMPTGQVSSQDMEADNPAMPTGQVSSQNMEANNPAMPTGQVSSQDMEADNPAMPTGQVSSQDMEADNPAMPTGQVTSQDMEADNSAMPTGQVTSQDMEDLEVGFLDISLDDEDPLPEPQPARPSSPPPTFTIVFYNLDFNVQTHHQSQTNRNKSIHWVHHTAVQDRISAHHLPDDQPIKPLPLYDIKDSLPTPDTFAHLRREFVVIGSRILTRHVPAFHQFSSVVVNHIPHQYSDIMSQPSTEGKAILLLPGLLHSLPLAYVPRTPSRLQPIFVGGDRLSEGCSRNIQWSFGEGESEEDRLDGLNFFFLDWHAVRNAFGIHEKVFMKEASARDHGTFYANMNKIQSSNAKKGPHAQYNAYKEAAHIDTCALFIAASLDHFRMDNPTDEPENLIPSCVREGTKEEKRKWFNDQVTEIVDKFIMSEEQINLADLQDGVARAVRPRQRERHSCREPGCPRTFVYVKCWLDHEITEHGLDFGEQNQQEESTSKPPPCDYKKQHTEARLSFGLFLEDMLDAIREGDGERLMRLYRVALLYYHAYGHTQYSYSTLLLTVQLNAVLTPAMAHRLTWNRFYNGKGGKGKNIPLDLHLEHMNNFLKSFLKGLGPNLTERSANRISRSLGCLKDILQRTDEELGVLTPSGYHHKGNLTQNIHSLVAVIREADLFTYTPGRAFSAFPAFSRNLFAKIKFDKMWDWIKDRLKLWAPRYF